MQEYTRPSVEIRLEYIKLVDTFGLQEMNMIIGFERYKEERLKHSYKEIYKDIESIFNIRD
jgi:hypothetical protein